MAKRSPDLDDGTHDMMVALSLTLLTLAGMGLILSAWKSGLVE
jgi:hypothetical protein